MSKVRADNISNRADDGAPALTYGAEIPVGIAITGAGNINVGGAATISGNLTVGGVLTYDDVTNVDSVGVVTARGGFEIGASGVGGTITAVGNAEITGIMTATEFHGSGANLTNLPASGDSNDITASLFI